MFNSDAIVNALLLERMLGRSLGNTDPFEMIKKVREWDESENKRQKEKAAKKPGPAPKIFSVWDLFFVLTALGIPFGLLELQGLILLFNQTIEMWMHR